MIDNNAILKAWDEWKVICSVSGCSQDNSTLLISEIGNAFRRKMFSITSESLHILGTEGEDIQGSRYNEENQLYAHEFDVGIEKAKSPDKNKRTGEDRQIKYYKDIAWSAVENSDDPPLKVIRGMLLGGEGNHAAPLNAIVGEFLEANFGYKLDGNTIKYYPPESLQTKVEGEDGGTAELGDFIEALCIPSELSSADKEFLDKEIPRHFSYQDAAIILACDVKLALTNSTLLDFIGVQKTQAYAFLDDVKRRLGHLLEESFDEDMWSPALSYIKNLFFMMLKAENSSSDLLYMLKTKMSEIGE